MFGRRLSEDGVYIRRPGEGRRCLITGVDAGEDESEQPAIGRRRRR